MAVSLHLWRLKLRCLSLLLLCGMIGFVVNGCRKKTALDSRISGLEKAFQNASAPAAVPNELSGTGMTASPPADAKACVNIALSAVQSNDFAGGVIALQMAQLMPRMTAEQHRAVYETMQAMTADLVARADKGDAKAKAQLARIERTRSQ